MLAFKLNRIIWSTTFQIKPPGFLQMNPIRKENYASGLEMLAHTFMISGLIVVTDILLERWYTINRSQIPSYEQWLTTFKGITVHLILALIRAEWPLQRFLSYSAYAELFPRTVADPPSSTTFSQSYHDSFPTRLKRVFPRPGVQLSLLPQVQM